MHFRVDQTLQKRYLLAICLTSLILIAEIIGGILSGSLALLSDAAHVFMDIFALGLSFFAMRLAARPPDDRHSYGWHRAEVIAALVNGSTLVLMTIGIWVEAYKRFRSPVEIRSTEMLVIAVIGLLINLLVAFILGRDSYHAHAHDHPGHSPRENINLRSAFLHVLGDAISSVGVIAAAILIRLTNAVWLDPLISIFIGLIIVVSAWRILRTSIHILLEGVPDGLSIKQINESLQSLPVVENIHDLHIWNLSSDSVALSAHITLTATGLSEPEDAMAEIKSLLDREFNIQHTTIQFEKTPCLDGHGGCN
jgi:cobalt-zinc-cadmium efflux system protein